MADYLIRKVWQTVWLILMGAYRKGAAKDVMDAVRAVVDFGVPKEQRFDTVLARLGVAFAKVSDSAVDVVEGQLDAFFDVELSEQTKNLEYGTKRALVEVAVRAEKARLYGAGA